MYSFDLFLDVSPMDFFIRRRDADGHSDGPTIGHNDVVTVVLPVTVTLVLILEHRKGVLYWKPMFGKKHRQWRCHKNLIADFTWLAVKMGIFLSASKLKVVCKSTKFQSGRFNSRSEGFIEVLVPWWKFFLGSNFHRPCICTLAPFYIRYHNRLIIPIEISSRIHHYPSLFS